MGQSCGRRASGPHSPQDLREASLRAAERRAAACSGSVSDVPKTSSRLVSGVPASSDERKTFTPTATPSQGTVSAPLSKRDKAERSTEEASGASGGRHEEIAAQAPRSLSSANASRTRSLALAAQAAAGKAAAARAEATAAARRAAEEFQQALRDGTLSGADLLRRCAVGVARDPSRCYVNHDDFGQAFWDKGHKMDYARFAHDFGFWAFSECQPGTERFVVGVAGGHVTVGVPRCLVSRSTAGDSGWYTPEMAQHGFTPHQSFWAFTASQPGTLQVAVMASITSPTRSMLLRVLNDEQRHRLESAPPPGFRHEMDFWAYPDPGPLASCDEAARRVKFSKHRGYIPAGGDLERRHMTVQAAQARCEELGCRGFTFQSEDAAGVVEVCFKDKWELVVSPGWTSYRVFRDGEFDPEVASEAAAAGRTPSEYKTARNKICIRGELLGTCEVLRKAECLKSRWPDVGVDLEGVALAAARHGFPDSERASHVHVELLHDDDAPNVELVQQLCKLGTSDARRFLQDWRVELIPLALRFLVEASDPGDASAALLLLGYCSWRLFDKAICPVIARRCFDRFLLSLKVDTDAHATVSLSDPREDFREWILGYLETHKQRAFASAFLEPSKLYWRRLYGGGSTQEADVEAHAANIYAALVEKTLGVRCPIPVSWDDTFAVHGAVEFLRASFLKGSLEATRRLENFGQPFARLVRTRAETDGSPAAVPLQGVRFVFPGARSPEDIATRVCSPGDEMRWERQQLLPYLERFTYYFEADFFMEAACNAALSDSLRSGARRCANALRCIVAADPEFAGNQRARVDCDSLPADDHELCRALLWDFDEYLFPKFDAVAARRFFRFIGGILSEIDIV